MQLTSYALNLCLSETQTVKPITVIYTIVGLKNVGLTNFRNYQEWSGMSGIQNRPVTSLDSWKINHQIIIHREVR